MRFLGVALAVGLGLSVAAPAAALEPLSCAAVIFLYDEEERVREKRTDTNGDCEPDEFVFYEEAVAVRGATDRDHDGDCCIWSTAPGSGSVAAAAPAAAALLRRASGRGRGDLHRGTRLPLHILLAKD